MDDGDRCSLYLDSRTDPKNSQGLHRGKNNEKWCTTRNLQVAKLLVSKKYPRTSFLIDISHSYRFLHKINDLRCQENRILNN